jgi:hypothetical protein
MTRGTASGDINSSSSCSSNSSSGAASAAAAERECEASLLKLQPLGLVHNREVRNFTVLLTLPNWRISVSVYHTLEVSGELACASQAEAL